MNADAGLHAVTCEHHEFGRWLEHAAYLMTRSV
jgi:hypothetical protein